MVTCYDLCFFVLNNSYNETIENIHMNEATGSTCDISPLSVKFILFYVARARVSTQT